MPSLSSVRVSSRVRRTALIARFTLAHRAWPSKARDATARAHVPTRRVRRGQAGLLAMGVLAAMLTAPAGANYTEGTRIAMRTVNNSPTHIKVSYCPRGHVSTAYKFGTRADPCNVITENNFPSPNGGRHTYTSNPFGLIISATGFKTVYFYARNPSVGKPFIEVNGHSYHMFEGQLTTVHTHGATIRLHREGDRNDLKQMTIEVIHLAKA